MNRNLALRIAGLLAIATALNHAFTGDAILRIIDMPAADMPFVRATHQIGTTGWIAGGVLLLAASTMVSTQARNWIVGVYCLVYGIPAVGNFMLVGGQINSGWIMLGLTVVFALIGRKPNSTSVHL